MQFIEPDELPKEAGAAIGRVLSAKGLAHRAWRVTYVWSTGSAYAVTLQRGTETRAFTVARQDGRFEAFDVTGR